MDYRNFGRTGAKVSTLCLGAMNFGDRTEEADAIAIIDRALDAGINFIDTADVYTRGASEEIVGRALARDGKREKVFLATKIFAPMSDDPNDRGVHRYHIMQGVENSLRRLQTDHIDLYQIHRPVPEVPVDETLRALDDLVRSGKVRYIGTSTFAAWQVVESLWASKELGLNRFVSEQPPLNLLDRRAERELLPMARTYGLAVIPWSPLGGGWLAGRYHRDESKPEDSRWAQKGWTFVRNVEQAYDQVEAFEKLVGEKGCTPAQLALAWCAGVAGVTSPIIGPRTMEQLEDNLAALDVEVTAEDRERLDEIFPPGTATGNFYNADFGPNARWL
jgi:aryl-alcohol dehydrogenase-like predicted oxidoreductase